MRLLNEPLSRLEWYADCNNKLRKEGTAVRITGCDDAQKLHMINALAASMDAAIVVAPNEVKARSLYEEYSFYDKNVMYYPAKDLIFYQADINGKQLAIDRMRVIGRLLSSERITVITTLDAFMTPMPPVEVVKNSIFSVDIGSIVDENAIAIKLVQMGYEKVYQVEGKGQFSIRGDIVDIFDLTQDNPVRIELWGDEVETIRSFDVLSQRSIENLQTITIFPASEMMISEDLKAEGYKRIEEDASRLEQLYRDELKTQEAFRIKQLKEELRTQLLEADIMLNLESYIKYFYEETSNLLELFEGRDTIIFLDELDRIASRGDAIELEYRESMIHRLDKGYVLPRQADILRTTKQCMGDIARFRTVSLAALSGSANEYLEYGGDYHVNTKLIPSYNGSFIQLVDDLKELKKKGYKVVIMSPSRSRAQRLAKDLTSEDVITGYTENEEKVLVEGEIVTFYGRLPKGFVYPDIKFSVISEMDILGQEKKKTKNKKVKYTGGTKIKSGDQLLVGDFVIHEDYGLGVYRGIEKVPVDNVVKDYMKIEYKDGDNLYVLATNLDIIQFYASKDADKKPKINKLGTQEWAKTKAKAQLSAEEVAKDLVHLYAVRSAKEGYQYSKDTVWQKEFEEVFPFEETQDQLAAINATKDDMESRRIMDRLICGDVGFGKTEVAIRAAFKAVQDGKQVAYLVPTTILAKQHYKTFVDRMKDYPVRVEMLSRFRTQAENKRTISDMKKGLVDIVIGTHRLLSKDVEFANLGLLVIDEEQRFGVSHKEKIKQLKENVDVLALTATPIPRTLHMSLIGIRDMSILDEAPLERLPIQTYVMEYNEEMVREAINRELARDGQVYYVYNKVSGIELITSQIQALVPEARVVFAHGQMNERELEDIMMRFVEHEIDVLVATTIIETGLDIPNVNTMIVHDSDTLGLSQLYQLRGRVGRSNRTSFAFLMYRRDKILREVAEKRLLAIKEFTELGSGFKIAMRDLEIRGAGAVLGKKQHGHMMAVGYDLYCKMLEEAVQGEKGIEKMSEHVAAIDLDVDAFIPESYVVNEVQKLDIYKRIANLKEKNDIDEMRDELKDRFGIVPKEAENLLRVALIKQNATRLHIVDIRGKVGRIKIVMERTAPVRVENVPLLLNVYAGDLRLQTKGRPEFTFLYTPFGLVEQDEELLLEKTEELLEKMEMLYREIVL